MSQHFFYPPSSSAVVTVGAVDQGNPNTAANGWPVKITDGTDIALITASGELNVVAAALPLPSGAATSAKQDTQITSLASIDTKLTSPLTVTGPLTDTQLRASAVPVSGTFYQATQPISAVALPLPSGAATEATLSTLNGKVTAVNTGAVVVSSSALPSGAATSANQVNTTGTIVNTALTATTASTASAPANARGFIIEAPSTNTDNIRWCCGSTASTTVGMLMEPGRDSGFIPLGANISVCATVSGTNAFSIQWAAS